MMKNPETNFAPGAVRKICNAGRNVFAVEWQAPDTRPSAPPVFNTMTPNVVRSFNNASRAASGVMPLALRNSYNVFTYSSNLSEVSGLMIVAPSTLTPYFSASAFTVASSPIKIRFAVFSSKIFAAARSVLSSSDSGNTIVFISCLALSLIPSINDIVISSLNIKIITLTVKKVQLYS